VGFQPTTPVFEWAKTIHVLECAASVICPFQIYILYNVLFIVDCPQAPELSKVYSELKFGGKEEI
jgi:hypothetical protein